jgi:taurine dioxygenase
VTGEDAMDLWSDQGGIRWRALEPFGVELDVDLSEPLSEDAEHQFTKLVWQHGLVIAHGQSLSPERQTALMSLLGPILQRAGEQGYISTETGHEVSRSALPFHADAAYTTAPLHALSLHAVDVVDGASSTRFANAVHACATLPAELHDVLATHSVDMIAPGFKTLDQRSCDIRDPEAMCHGERPGLYEHPHTGAECVWVSEMHAARILGMSWEESRAVLTAVFDHLYAPEKIYEHVWRRGDIVIWDNIGLQHARPPLHQAGKRVLQRVIVGTEGVAPHVRAGIDMEARANG